METTQVKITGMVCDACAGHVQRSLSAVPGVQSVRVDRAAGSAAVRHTGVNGDELLAAVARAGYEAEVARETP